MITDTMDRYNIDKIVREGATIHHIVPWKIVTDSYGWTADDANTPKIVSSYIVIYTPKKKKRP